MKKSNKFSPEVRERAVRMVLEHRSDVVAVADLVEDHPPRTRPTRRQPPDHFLVRADDGHSNVGAEPLDEHPHRRLRTAARCCIGVDDELHDLPPQSAAATG